MKAQLIVLLRYALVTIFAALGGALVAKGIITEDQAGLLTSDAFIEAAASFAAAGLIYLYYLIFSDASKALVAWIDDPEK
jgi:hypothetical protein